MTSISSSASAVPQSAVPKVSLRADLARYEKQLADCINCASAKTPEGKRNIQQLDTRISTLKAQLEVAPQTTDATAVSRVASGSASLTTGGRVDVYA